jgi:hypothetical protein
VDSGWELRNLVVQVKDPALLDQAIHARVSGFARREKLLSPKAVAYTIFPDRFYRQRGNAEALFDGYNRQRGLYDRLKTRWGTYFRRMTKYETTDGEVNQLRAIIGALRAREAVDKAAYTMIIQKPGSETIRHLGGPCLNYLAIQAERTDHDGGTALGLLAVYRNHDFLRRAYGNYWGLCNLIGFLANEVGATPAPLTCISSHAYVDGKKVALKRFVGGL